MTMNPTSTCNLRSKAAWRMDRLAQELYIQRIPPMPWDLICQLVVPWVPNNILELVPQSELDGTTKMSHKKKPTWISDSPTKMSEITTRRGTGSISKEVMIIIRSKSLSSTIQLALLFCAVRKVNYLTASSKAPQMIYDFKSPASRAVLPRCSSLIRVT